MSATNRSQSSVFDVIQVLDSQDVHANRKRKSTTTSLTRKSKAARSQTKIHGLLMECRILLQRAITTTPMNSSVVDAVCNQVLAQLLHARRLLSSSSSSSLSRNKEDSSINYTQVVTSDTTLSELLQHEYEKYRHEWKEVLNRRHKDLKLHAGLTAKAQFRVMDSSFWQQVDATVSHEQLLHREEQQQSTVFFDDTKVYQHMLQDFLSFSTEGGTTAEEAAAQRLRRAVKDSTASSKKRTSVVDRRASKGRKIRYAEIPKLVNFTFPVARPPPSNTGGGMEEDEWFLSLFGGAARSKGKSKLQS